LPIVCLKLGRIIAQGEPGAIAIGVNLAQLAVTLERSADIPAPFLGGSSGPPAMKPAINQQMGLGPGDRLKLLDLGHEQVDLTLKRHPFLVAHLFLPIQPRL
jgi:hypothetical protein